MTTQPDDIAASGAAAHGSPRASVRAWAIVGVAALLSQAIVRLLPRGIEALTMSLTAAQWLFGVGVTVFMLYTEGYKAFHQRFVPRVLSRADEVSRRKSFVHAALAPLYALSLIGDSLRRTVIQLTVLVAIVVLIVLVRLLSQPWRGLVDVAVCLALGWGVVDLLIGLVRPARTKTP